MNTLSIPRLVVAGTSSGVGKTTLAAGLIAALRRQPSLAARATARQASQPSLATAREASGGLAVQPFKCGPDYIDPGYHTAAAGRACRNLDSWMLDDGQVVESFWRACAGADVAIVEGVMGLYDGSDFEDERASAAQIAKLLGAPVLLVLDISGAARSAAAMATGFAQFDSALRVGGCVLNLAGSPGHAAGCARAIAAAGGPPVLGWLPRRSDWRVPERHLGLVLERERSEVSTLVASVADAIEAQFDLDELLRLARSAEPVSVPQAASLPPAAIGDAAPVLAVARDDAFCFYYPDNLELVEEAGARLAFFSPIAGERPPADAAGVYLGGGYPELHAAALAANRALWDDLRARHARGQPIWAECGGFMVLTEALVDLEGRRWPMAGLVPGVARMTDRLASLGYRHATAPRSHLLAEAGETLRGHEFHCSVWERGSGADESPAWHLRNARGGDSSSADGYARNLLLASYVHIHLGQNPRLARRLVDRLRSAAGAPAGVGLVPS